MLEAAAGVGLTQAVQRMSTDWISKLGGFACAFTPKSSCPRWGTLDDENGVFDKLVDVGQCVGPQAETLWNQ